jgi:hypothetical protein
VFLELFVVLLEEDGTAAGVFSAFSLLASVVVLLVITDWWDSTLVSIPSSSTG